MNWSVSVYYADTPYADHWIFSEKDCPTVMDCIKLVEKEVQDKSVIKVVLYKRGDL